MKAADECFSSLENTWVSHSQSTLYTLINYEFAESDLQYTHRPCCITRRGECQESVSFTQGEVFKAACLHPARAQNINCRDNQASKKMDPVTEESLTYTSIFLCSPVWLSPVALSHDLRKEMLWVEGHCWDTASPYGPVVSVWLTQLLMKIRGTVGGLWWPLHVDVWRPLVDKVLIVFLFFWCVSLVQPCPKVGGTVHMLLFCKQKKKIYILTNVMPPESPFYGTLRPNILVISASGFNTFISWRFKSLVRGYRKMAEYWTCTFKHSDTHKLTNTWPPHQRPNYWSTNQESEQLVLSADPNIWRASI